MAQTKKTRLFSGILTSAIFIALVLTAYAYHDIAHKTTTREAMERLAAMLDEGRGVPADPAQAEEWRRKAREIRALR